MNDQNAGIHENWYGKPYYSLDAYCKNTYGEKLYKVSLNAGLTCPNRDGTIGTGGCIFCSAGGSGDFAAKIVDGSEASFREAYEESLSLLGQKKTGHRYIAYFQAYSNTYGPAAYLEKLYTLALTEPTVSGISIATRPDCINQEIVELLIRLKEAFAPKFIWIELGLQTIHDKTAAFIRRGYPLSRFEACLEQLCAADIPTITHVILGLPGETKRDMLETVHYLNNTPVFGIKLQLLHILKDTDLGTLYQKAPDKYCRLNTLELYLNTLIPCITHLRPDIVIHRLTGDAPRPLLLAPLFSSDKRRVLNTLHKQMKEQNAFQGKHFTESLLHNN